MAPTHDFASDTPHRRQNLLTGEWVLVSPQRNQRPWQGRVEAGARDLQPQYDPGCYLCPGNVRAAGRTNPGYDDVFVFDNDYPALLPVSRASDAADSAPVPGDLQPEMNTVASTRGDDPGGLLRGDDPGRLLRGDDPGRLLRAEPERGICRVVCFSPRHDVTLPELDQSAIRRVVDAWTHEYERLGAHSDIAWVQIFENKGALMGCSNPHPHGQIWAQRSLPETALAEAARQQAHFDVYGRSLLADYLRLELELEERIVTQNDGFVALVPFWAVWPFETLIVSREHRRSLSDLSDAERDALADILKRLTTRYDNLFQTSFPYSAGIHQAPTDGAGHPEWHLHMHFYPPLLRSANVRKFMVGYEMLGEPQRDLTPESAAERLQALSEVHYRTRGPG